MEELLLVRRGTPPAVDDELDPVACGIGCSPAHGTEESRVEVGYTRNRVVEDRRPVGDGAVGFAKRSNAVAAKGGAATLANRTTAPAAEIWGTVRLARGASTATALEGWWGRRGGRRQLVADCCGDRRDDDEQAGDAHPANPIPAGRCSGWFAVGHAAISGGVVLPARMRFSIRRRYAPARSIEACPGRTSR